jgi:CspA family cold shock protein
MSDSSLVSEPRVVGKVKWFNNKSGFGFITVCDGDYANKDIFVHFTSVNVSDTQYRYLVQGEYVEFDLTKPNRGDHELHATNVSGVKGWSLMCETRRLNAERRPYEPRVYKTPDESVVRERRALAHREVANSDGFIRVENKRATKSVRKIVEATL